MNFWQCPIGIYEVKLQAVEEVKLPAYKGGTIDGALDRAVHATACGWRGGDYQKCPCGLNCPYIAIFEPQYLHQSTSDDPLRRYAKTPRLYGIDPPREKRSIYPPSAILTFRFLLFGEGVNYLPWFIMGLQTLEQKGIGSGRGKVKLLSVQSVHPFWERRKPIYHHEEGVFPHDSLLIYPEEIAQKASEFLAEEVTLEFLTHTRIKYRKKWVRQPRFAQLFLAIDRRARLLSTFYGEGVGEKDSLLKEAEQIETKSQDVRWYDWGRYSSRQQNNMRLGGFIGTVTYAGEQLAQFMPYLLVGALIHVGKPHFGMGKYVIRNHHQGNA